MARQRGMLKHLLDKLRRWYESETREGHRFRYSLLAFDLVTILFIVVTSFLPRTTIVELLDILFGVVHGSPPLELT